MHSTLRKALLVSTVGICGVIGGPVGASIFVLAPHHPLSAAALANDDDDDGGDRGNDDHGGRDDGDRNDRSDRDDGDRDDRDHGRDNDDGQDDRDDGDDRQGDNDGDGRGRNHAEDDRNDVDDDRDDNKHDDDRYETQLKVSDRSLKGLLNGSLVAVDNLGRVLEVDVEFEHGRRVVKVEPHRSDIRRKPGPIEKVSIRPAS